MISTDIKLIAPWVMEKTSCSIASDCTAIGQMLEDKLVAGVMYEHFTGCSVVATIAVEGGYAMSKEFVRAIFDYPFRQMGAEQMIAFISEDNERSIRLVEKMGFREQTRIPGVFPEDMVVFILKRDNCRFLESENG